MTTLDICDFETDLDYPATRILLIDCNRFELTTFAASLRVHGFDVVGEASERRVALQLFKATKPDLVIVSFQGCDDSVINITHRFREDKPSLGIILLSPSPDLRLFGFNESDLPRGTQIIQKSLLHNLEQINIAIEAASDEDALTAWTFAHFDAGLMALTDVQIETLRMVAHGLSNGDIAKIRYVTEKSVEQTVGRIAQHLRISYQKGRNLRVILAAEYFKWMGSARHHQFK